MNKQILSIMNNLIKDRFIEERYNTFWLVLTFFLFRKKLIILKTQYDYYFNK